jgi:arginase
MKNQFILTPFDLDQPAAGLHSLARAGWEINQPSLPGGSIQRCLSALHEPLAQWVAKTLAHGERPVSIAGDCCSTIGVMAGLQRAGLDPVFVWLDAHGDFNTWETTLSGFLGGMPLAMIVGRGEQTMAQAVGLVPFAENRVILSDARDLDPAEKQALAGSAVHHLPDTRALLQDPLIAQPLYVHLDVDIVNPDDAPAMSYRAEGGPSAAELRDVLRALAGMGRIAAVSMATWNPKLDQDGRSQAACLELLRCLTG